LLYGSQYWRDIINFDALVRYDAISADDLELLQFADDPKTALRLLKEGVTLDRGEISPAFAMSLTSSCS
jgi:predicted Rossmann-fold nucleotide-binding protein